ncbi:MAG: MFS transporter [Candidatus Eisenbacteria bacterium]|uniref:MFS transporter n=1 Tax=Eiseniibacteriota bacterium TaxID=2212470 RepID=A0A956LZC4_UNCEI|nr:MFS transporter [Candidatus Eisenbacteria bacterium]
MRSGFAALGHRNYRLFWIGQVVSLFGTWMQSVAQSWLVLELTHSTFQVGLVVALQFTPILIFGLFAGVIVDRLDKRRALVVTQTLAAAQAAALAILTVTGAVRVEHVMLLAALLGTVNALDMPMRQAFVTEMVGRRDVMNAVALNSSAFNIARIIGPAIGGVLIGLAGVATAFFVNAVTFVAVIGALLMMRREELHPVERAAKETVWSGLRGGLGFVRRTPVVYVSILLVGIVATFGMNFNVILPGMARDIFRIGSTGFGLLMSSIGVGSLVAGLFLAFFQRVDPVRLMVQGALGFSVLSLAFAFSPHFAGLAWVILNLVAIGFCTICMTATANTNLQRTAPDALRGRVMSVYITIFAGTMPLGSLFAGWLASRFGAPVALGSGGLLSAVGTAWAWWQLSRHGTVAADAAEPKSERAAIARAGDTGR